MKDVAVLTPVALLLLMVLLGRLERWLDDATLPVPPRESRRRRRRTARSVASASPVQGSAGRRRLAHRGLGTRRRTSAAVRPESVPVPGAARPRRLLGSRARRAGRSGPSSDAPTSPAG